MVWTSAQRVYVVEAFIRSNESVIMAQREFRTRFQIPPRDSVPDRKSIVLWQSVLQSPHLMSDRSVRRILHMDLHFHPYKMVVVQKLPQRDWQSRMEAWKITLESLPPDAVVFFSD
ncbi:hypothetical protein J6590_084419 [Homalodisca vitripennis]|nr:hypothetical protein J6590_084419 [Homalodisca vitripennis]